MLGSRAFSNDSIFNAEHSHSDPEPLRILSQENIHGKIRALFPWRGVCDIYRLR
uniref:Uncharacterized protein n=1 Tax=Sinocyclocheilus rhinocerous TaxID=307959 RepID=A0A673K2Q9_9TELE